MNRPCVADPAGEQARSERRPSVRLSPWPDSQGGKAAWESRGDLRLLHLDDAERRTIIRCLTAPEWPHAPSCCALWQCFPWAQWMPLDNGAPRSVVLGLTRDELMHLCAALEGAEQRREYLPAGLLCRVEALLRPDGAG